MLDLKRVESLARRQGALNVPVRYGNRSLGSLEGVIRGVHEPKVGDDLSKKLMALERLCFNFNHLPSLDLSTLSIPSFIPSTEIATNVEVFRHNNFEYPYFRVTFYEASLLQRSKIGYLQVVYEPYSRSLFVYTCAGLQIEAGERLPLELIPKGYLTAAEVLRVLSIPVEYAYAFYILGPDDYRDRICEVVRPVVQDRINHVFHVFSKLGFEEGFPPGATTKEETNRAMMIHFSRLEQNFKEYWWDWAYVYRFGEELARLLDREEIERRLGENEAALKKKVEEEIGRWRGKGGALEILAKENPSEEEILSIILDPKISPEVLTQALAKLLSRGEVSKSAKQRIVDAFKTSIFNVYALEDDRLDDYFWWYLPNSAKFFLLESREFPWELKKKIFFEIKDRDGFAVLESKDVIERIQRVLREFTADQIKELLQMKERRNKDVMKVYRDLLNAALAQKTEDG